MTVRAKALLIAVLAGGCVATPPGEAFLVDPLPELAPFERAGSADPIERLLQPDFSVPTHLRPCCAFGHGLGVTMARVPLPAVEIANVIDPDLIGQHTYNGGLVSAKHGVRRGFVSSERNGLVYTSRGGFIDLAHVRDYADWTAFLSRRLEATLETGGALELPEEGARRFVFHTALDSGLIQRVGRRELAVQLAQWLAFQLSVWHETATWYGWSAIGIFPERASAFSPEDLYSNLLGIKLASYLVLSGQAETEADFNRGMDREIRSVLGRLGAVSPAETRRALDSVDGHWWSSQERLPSPDLVLRRNLSLGPELSPWRVPESLVNGEPPVVLRYPTSVEGVAFERIARLDVQVEPRLAESVPLSDTSGRWLGQRELGAIVARLRAEERRP